MVHTKREEDTEKDSNIPESNANDKDSKRSEVEARYDDVKVASAKEIAVQEKDRQESEIAVATFAELVSVTSRQRQRNLRNRCEEIMTV